MARRFISVMVLGHYDQNSVCGNHIYAPTPTNRIAQVGRFPDVMAGYHSGGSRFRMLIGGMGETQFLGVGHVAYLAPIHFTMSSPIIRFILEFIPIPLFPDKMGWVNSPRAQRKRFYTDGTYSYPNGMGYFLDVIWAI